MARPWMIDENENLTIYAYSQYSIKLQGGSALPYLGMSASLTLIIAQA